MLQWGASGYRIPSPPMVKRAAIRRNAVHGGTFVETGTFFGDTSAYACRFSTKVITLEPARELYEAAVRRFSRKRPQVELINATSEEAFPGLVPRLEGDITFWLDGHYSGGITYEGEQHTPLLRELECIGPHVGRFGRLAVLVDDIHACGTNPAYPPMSMVLDWARAHGLPWHIEHDILVMTKPAAQLR